jgi:hypothetical protein
MRRIPVGLSSLSQPSSYGCDKCPPSVSYVGLDAGCGSCVQKWTVKVNTDRLCISSSQKTFPSVVRMTDETRRAPRHRVLKTGSITFGGSAIDCVLRNVSKTGAALEVTSPIGIPDQFVLVVPADDSRHRCSVVWRKERRIGVAFN